MIWSGSAHKLQIIHNNYEFEHGMAMMKTYSMSKINVFMPENES